MAMRAVPFDEFLESATGERPGSAPKTFDWRRLIAEGRAARALADGGRWRIGQLALLVERRYASGALRRFADEIGESTSTVRRYRWVAGAYDTPTVARFPELSFSHFQAVAGLPDRLIWLERARRGAWSVDRLVAESRRTGAAPSIDARMRRPIDNATRAVDTLLDRVDDVRLPARARAEMVEAVDDLAERLTLLRAKLAAKPRRRRLTVAR